MVADPIKRLDFVVVADVEQNRLVLHQKTIGQLPALIDPDLDHNHAVIRFFLRFLLSCFPKLVATEISASLESPLLHLAKTDKYVTLPCTAANHVILFDVF